MIIISPNRVIKVVLGSTELFVVVESSVSFIFLAKLASMLLFHQICYIPIRMLVMWNLEVSDSTMVAMHFRPVELE